VVAEAAENSGRGRRAGTRARARRLLDERKRMFVLYSRLVEFAPFTERVPEPELRDEFCEILVDYMACGHFGLFRRLLEGRERRVAAARLGDGLYPRIAESTDAVVHFNDRYAGARKLGDHEAFARDLSALGEHLARRVEVEDRMLELLLEAEEGGAAK
jgi:regulator of sigma D